MPYKTIEERAKEYVPDAFDVDLSLPTMGGYIVNALQDAYIQGATEQEAFDDDLLREVKKMLIDKAWRWIELYRNMGVHWTLEQMEEHFRKAMEE